MTIAAALNKWTAPLAALSVIVGGVIWLTTLHHIATQNQIAIANLRLSFNQTKNKIYPRLNNLDERLARIEGKLDYLVENRNRN